MENKKKILLLSSISVVIFLFFISWKFFPSIFSFSSLSSSYKNLYLLSKVISYVKNEYIEEVNPIEVMRGAYRGIMESMGPFASYLQKDEVEKYEKIKKDLFGDVGILAIKRGVFFQVIGLIDDSPAEKHNIKVGDFINEVNGMPVHNLNFWELKLELTGLPDTDVKIKIIKNHVKRPEEIVMKRKEIYKNPITFKVDEKNDIGIIKTRSLFPGTAIKFDNVLNKIYKKKIQKIVIDLRDTWEGEMKEGIEISNLFLKKKKEIFLERNDGKKEYIKSKILNKFYDVSLIMLINKATLGPGEIIPFLLKGENLVKIVGDNSGGCAYDFRLFKLEDGSGIILPVNKIGLNSKYLSEEGVVPDSYEDFEDGKFIDKVYKYFEN
ncbi:MAG: S41 family peptidase [Acidobacteriota bacterium]